MLTRVCEKKQQELERQKCIPGGSRKPAATAFGLDLGQVSNDPAQKQQEKNQDTRRRSERVEGGENRFLGGSDHILSGLSAAQRLRRQGSLPPNLSSKVSRSVAGRVVGDTASRN